LEPGQEIEMVFALGADRAIEDVRRIVRELVNPGAARAELARVREQWRAQLSQLTIHTPHERTDLLANGWLLYQVLAARMFGRSGYYQSGGAWGFRDQLQDCMALLHARPDLAHAQLLRCAGRQFTEGDVQHWWHPPSGKGVRTRISDDYLWLPHATARYVEVTGDTKALDETMPFIEGRPLAVDEESSYDTAQASLESASLYDHCKRAIEHGLRFGAHGLPLIGSGDWNDGMNRIGHLGRGESVWLAFFLHDVLTRFAPLADARGDTAAATKWRGIAKTLAHAIDARAWDGAWYLRAWTDDGVPVGSASSEECKIDSLPQSWAVLAVATDRARAGEAMGAVLRTLVHDDLRLVQLFAPPFDHSPIDPGYIKGYVPGVRENGGQYTHAAVWVAMALAKLGRHETAWRVARLLNPLSHATSQVTAAHYKVEPYVMAADVYMAQGHAGRGGWTWYTGSAGWMHRLIVESLLGLTRRGTWLAFTPCVPDDWDTWSVDYREGGSLYRIAFAREGIGSAMTRIVLDGLEQKGDAIELRDDGHEHAVEVRIGGASTVAGHAAKIDVDTTTSDQERTT
ncbi:MAG: cyclic beta 1-2 glucan synthetase, partial [Pseudomonadota bacterium]|nr:cyclic beta 1-2 glucan synthetase [Pseudomonadota bacterium]